MNSNDLCRLENWDLTLKGCFFGFVKLHLIVFEEKYIFISYVKSSYLKVVSYHLIIYLNFIISN